MFQQIVDLVSQGNLTTLGTDYANHILSVLRSGSTYAGYITAAVAATVIYNLYDKLTVPRELRHLPSVPFSKFIAATWRGEAEDIIQEKLYLPAYGEHGLLVAERSGLTARLFGRSSIVFRNGDHWKRHRKIANPAFHRSMPVQLFGTLTQALFKKVEADGNRIDVHDYMQRFTLDVIGKASFGFDFQVSSYTSPAMLWFTSRYRSHTFSRISSSLQSIDDAGSKWSKIYNDVVAGISAPIFAIFPVLDQHFLWAFPNRRNLHQKMDQLDKLFMDVIEKKKQVITQDGYDGTSEVDNEKDLLTLMIEANVTEQEDKGLSDSELKFKLKSYLDSLVFFYLLFTVLGQPCNLLPCSPQIRMVLARRFKSSRWPQNRPQQPNISEAHWFDG
ncbi:cytochrome P450 [Jimgerdemannia flammicorona]|uniref:Cytochrome P450 n=1 Tax=Jimgerdemannia flammicorona TaxID=994334 RepID=A0A433D6B3_9FUNG|nr:cytochrome P450 [Jimgerdemannia flammicorona]